MTSFIRTRAGIPRPSPERGTLFTCSAAGRSQYASCAHLPKYWQPRSPFLFDFAKVGVPRLPGDRSSEQASRSRHTSTISVVHLWRSRRKCSALHPIAPTSSDYRRYYRDLPRSSFFSCAWVDRLSTIGRRGVFGCCLRIRSWVLWRCYLVFSYAGMYTPSPSSRHRF